MSDSTVVKTAVITLRMAITIPLTVVIGLTLYSSDLPLFSSQTARESFQFCGLRLYTCKRHRSVPHRAL